VLDRIQLRSEPTAGARVRSRMPQCQGWGPMSQTFGPWGARAQRTWVPPSMKIAPTPLQVALHYVEAMEIGARSSSRFGAWHRPLTIEVKNK
jgi:hypothetical protein